jgi:large subunit ribosomal protein L3
VALELLCRKVGMTQIFSDSGECIPVTVLEAGPNTVIQKKTAEKEGYDALQLGYADRRPSRTPKPLAGHFQKAGVAPKRELCESRVSAEEVAGYEVGQSIDTEIFSEGQHVDVVGVSKGRGTTGVVKRHNFAIKRRTHGTHEFFRHAGAIGAGAWPARVLKGMKMAGRHGNAQTTAVNQEVVRIDADRSLLFIRGAVPGHKNAIVRVRPSIKARGG